MDKIFELRNSVGYIAEAIACLQRAECLLENASMPLKRPDSEAIDTAVADLAHVREELLGLIALPYNEAVARAEENAYAHAMAHAETESDTKEH